MYTQEQLDSIYIAKRRIHHAGRPEIAARIDYLMSLEAPYEKVWEVAQADVEAMVKPEKPTDVIPPPPYTGREATTEAWRSFAHKVSDMDPEIVDSMGRNDLIRVLSDRGIIEAPEVLLGD